MSSSIVQMDFQYFTVTLWHCCQHFRSLCPNLPLRRSQRGRPLEFLWGRVDLAGSCLPSVSYLHTQRLRRVSNLQACHDILRHHFNLQAWDHFTVSWVCSTDFSRSIGNFHCCFSHLVGLRGPMLLRAVRLVVGSFSVLATARFSRRPWHRNGVKLPRASSQSLWLHNSTFRFYMSRTLPNVFCTTNCNVGACWISTSKTLFSAYKCLILLSLAAAVFRCDLLVLIAPVGLSLLWQRRVNFFKAALVTALAAFLGACLSIVVGLHPLATVGYGQSLRSCGSTQLRTSPANGETQPFLWYFYSAIPRALLGSLPLALLGLFLEPRSRLPVAVAMTFVLLYSFFAA